MSYISHSAAANVLGPDRSADATVVYNGVSNTERVPSDQLSAPADPLIEEGVNGYLVPVDEPDALAKRCAQILASPDLGERMGAAGWQRVGAEFTLARQLEDYLDVYRRRIRTGADRA